MKNPVNYILQNSNLIYGYLVHKSIYIIEQMTTESIPNFPNE